MRPSHARPTVTIDEASSTLRLRQALVHRVSSQSEAVDVIRLLAARKSNREIADELFISVNTAANHVRAILMKTGSSNRTQAAMFAVDRGLTEAAG